MIPLLPNSTATPWYPGGIPGGALDEVMTSRLKSPGIAGGTPSPNGVVTTLTACPVAKNEYCPPGIDAISHFPQMPLRYQLHASLDADGLEKDTSFPFHEVFREQFLCYAQLLNAR
jgi:hypothetical protein